MWNNVNEGDCNREIRSKFDTISSKSNYIDLTGLLLTQASISLQDNRVGHVAYMGFPLDRNMILGLLIYNVGSVIQIMLVHGILVYQCQMDVCGLSEDLNLR